MARPGPRTCLTFSEAASTQASSALPGPPSPTSAFLSRARAAHGSRGCHQGQWVRRRRPRGGSGECDDGESCGIFRARGLQPTCCRWLRPVLAGWRRARRSPYATALTRVLLIAGPWVERACISRPICRARSMTAGRRRALTSALGQARLSNDMQRRWRDIRCAAQHVPASLGNYTSLGAFPSGASAQDARH